MTSLGAARVARGNPKSAEVETGGQAAKTGNLFAPCWVHAFLFSGTAMAAGTAASLLKATGNPPQSSSSVGGVPIPSQSSQTPEAEPDPGDLG